MRRMNRLERSSVARVATEWTGHFYQTQRLLRLCLPLSPLSSQI